MRETARATATKIWLRGSAGSREPAGEKPWQGGPDKTTTGLFAILNGSDSFKHRSRIVLDRTLPASATVLGKFFANVFSALEFTSTPTTTWRPRFFAASDSPPRPLHRSCTPSSVVSLC